MRANEGSADFLVDALIAAGAAFFGYLAVGGVVTDPRAAVAGAAVAMGVASAVTIRPAESDLEPVA